MFSKSHKFRWRQTTMFERELWIERDFFRRFKLRLLNTPANLLLQGTLYLIMLPLVFFYCILVIPGQILILKPSKLSFWTYFFWLVCVGLMILGLFSDDRPSGLVFNLSAVPDNISSIYINLGLWGIVIIGLIFLLNILALFARIHKLFASNG